MRRTLLAEHHEKSGYVLAETRYISHQRDVKKEFCFKAIKRSLHSSAKDAGAGVILIGLIRFLPSFSDAVSFYCPGRLQKLRMPSSLVAVGSAVLVAGAT